MIKEAERKMLGIFFRLKVAKGQKRKILAT
jgi:hypothetical protein